MFNQLIAIRHGHTDWNDQGRFQGHRDIALNDAGKADALRNASLLLEIIGEMPVSIWSSPLMRCRQTAEIIAKQTQNSRIRFDERLKEASFGLWEGLTSQEVKANFPLERKARKQDRWNYAPPEGQSLATISDQMRSFMDSLDSDSTSPPIVLVTHSGNIRALRALTNSDNHNDPVQGQIGHVGLHIWDGDSFHLVDK